jgi:hypothetical protein|tara:strand:+ start:440 stop:883 length:444 start_codon:yes stop_codon:yes gene_type:complete
MLYRLNINIRENEINRLCENFDYKYFDETIILTENGLLKYDKDNLTIYKINFNDKDDLLLKNYVDNIDVYQCENIWKKQNVCYHIPYLHEIVNIKRYIFSPRKGAPLNYSIECIDNKVVDHYFSTTIKDHTDILLKEDISLFLNYIK